MTNKLRLHVVISKVTLKEEFSNVLQVDKEKNGIIKFPFCP